MKFYIPKQFSYLIARPVLFHVLICVIFYVTQENSKLLVDNKKLKHSKTETFYITRRQKRRKLHDKTTIITQGNSIINEEHEKLDYAWVQMSISIVNNNFHRHFLKLAIFMKQSIDYLVVKSSFLISLLYLLYIYMHIQTSLFNSSYVSVIGWYESISIW